MKDEKWKSASPRQMKRITQLVKLCGVGVNFQGVLTGHKATQLINWMVVQGSARVISRSKTMTTETKKLKLTNAQRELIDRLNAQVEAAEKHPGAYSRGLSPGTSLCHKTVAKSLVRLGLCEYRSAWHGQIVDLKA